MGFRTGAHRGRSIAAGPKSSVTTSRRGLLDCELVLQLTAPAVGSCSYPIILTCWPQPVRSREKSKRVWRCWTTHWGSAKKTGERWLVAELDRHKGQLLLRKGHAEAAEELYRKALSIAEAQGAKLWELRAAVGLARLCRDGGHRAAARDLLGRSKAGSLRASPRSTSNRHSFGADELSLRRRRRRRTSAMRRSSQVNPKPENVSQSRAPHS